MTVPKKEGTMIGKEVETNKEEEVVTEVMVTEVTATEVTEVTKEMTKGVIHKTMNESKITEKNQIIHKRQM